MKAKRENLKVIKYFDHMYSCQEEENTSQQVLGGDPALSGTVLRTEVPSPKFCSVLERRKS